MNESYESELKTLRQYCAAMTEVADPPCRHMIEVVREAYKRHGLDITDPTHQEVAVKMTNLHLMLLANNAPGGSWGLPIYVAARALISIIDNEEMAIRCM